MMMVVVTRNGRRTHEIKSYAVVGRKVKPATGSAAGRLQACCKIQLMIGRVVGRHQILGKIGAGGMGVVYRARDMQLERDVALKLVGAQSHIDQEARARLLQEARTASALNHPNICTIYEAGVADADTYIAMELVEGQLLSEMVPHVGLPPEVVMRYGVQIADALA